MQVAGEYELDRKREKQRLESRLQRLEEQNADLTHSNESQAMELEAQGRQVAKLNGDLEKLTSLGAERVKDVEQLLVVARWQLAERTQQLYALHKALKSLQSPPPAARKLPGAAPSENDDPEGGALVAAGSLALCASLKSSIGLDLDESIRELEAAAAAVKPFSVEAALEAAERGDAKAFERILQPASAPSAAALPAAAHGFDMVLGQALCRAAAGGHLAIASRCVSLGASASVRSSANDMGQSALLAAAAAGHEGVVKLLLSKAAGGGSGVDDTDAYKRTALHLAAAGNHGAVAKLLLFNGASPAAVDSNGLTPADTAEGTEGLLAPQQPSASRGGPESGRDKRPGAHFRTGELSVNRRAPAVIRVLTDPNVRFWNASVRANRAYQDKQFSKAIAAYTDALTLATGAGGSMAASPRDLATLHYNRARARYRLGAHCAAIEDCSTALEHDPSYRNALAQVGAGWVPSDCRVHACTLYFPLQLQRAECYMSVFDHKRAAQDFQVSVDIEAPVLGMGRRGGGGGGGGGG
jgi:tetratricopeptide (TPR) repeat protein